MARIVASSCPKCGAALEVAPKVDVVTCHYCGHRSIIEWQGRRTPPSVQVHAWQGDPSVGRIAIPAQPSGAGVVGAMIAAGVFMVVVVAGVAAALMTRPTTSLSSPSRPDLAAEPASPQATPAGLQAGSAKAVVAPDLHAVDIAELVRQARPIALAEEPHATALSSVVAFQVVGGVLDTTQANAASVAFSFKYTDPTKAPGQKDVVEGSVTVHVRSGGMEPRKFDAFYREKSLAAPTCSSKDAWVVAVKSGVPANAVTTFHLYDNTPFSPKSPTVWSIRVDGHDEYRREIDATSCALVKSWGAVAKPRKR